MNMKTLTKILTLIIAVIMCVSAFAACAGGDTSADENETKYLEAFEKLEAGDYEAAYALFTELGDYKDAAKEAAYFRYMPTNHHLEYISDNESDTVTYKVTLNDKNLPSTIIEEYASGLKHTCIFTYNEFGHVARRECSDTEGTTTLYETTYDENGNLVNETLTDKDGNVSKFDYTYNEKGEMVKIVPTNAPDYYISCTFTYDAEGREIKATYEFEDSSENSFEETTYNEDGKILKKTWFSESGELYSVDDYKYDEKGRLVEVLFTELGEDIGYRKITYNDKDQMLSEHIFYTFNFEYTNSFEYDEHGNAVKTTCSSVDSMSGETITYSDVTDSEYKLVYLPFDYTEEEWTEICDSTQCWDLTHQF
jgi:YD repeat-containing protein